MSTFHYHKEALYVEDIALTDIAVQYGTPCYVYSRATIEQNWQAFDAAFGSIPHMICYAVKANSNLAILNLMARLGSGFDIVSQGELERVLAAGGKTKHLVFSGVGKKPAEILRALEAGIHCFNVESEVELDRIQELAAQTKQVARIALRINPNIDAGTHPYIATGLKENKFGIDFEDALNLVEKIQKQAHLELIGLACHIGSQLTEIDPFLAAIERILVLVTALEAKNIHLQHINVGGGLGVTYQNENPPIIKEYVDILCQKLGHLPYQIIIEPGRAIIANAGILLTKIEYIKHTAHKNFAIVDAGMNDLIRPALYEAWQNIIPVTQAATAIAKNYDVVGPVCESADFLGKDRLLALQVNQLLAVCSAGAYGFSMASTYNSRPRVAEVMVDKNKSYLIRKREDIADLFAHESLLPL